MGRGPVTIKAIEAVKCIRSGMNDAELMERFDISSNGLQILFDQLLKAGIINRQELEGRQVWAAPGRFVDEIDFPDKSGGNRSAKKPLLNAAEAVQKIRAGMGETELMKDYNLSAKGVQSLYTKLISAGLLDEAEINHAEEETSTKVIVDEDSESCLLQTECENRAVDPEGLVELIQTGSRKEDLMRAFGLTEDEVDSWLEIIIEMGFMQPADLQHLLTESTVEFSIVRASDGAVLYAGRAASLTALVCEAVSKGVDLTGADLSALNAARADLSGARLTEARLRGANLVGTDLTGARLDRAVLSSADMSGAVLYKANLSDAELSDANMSMIHAVWAFMPGAILSEANLTRANLYGANLSGANLFEAILSEADLTGACLDNVDLGAARGVTFAS